jgi:hypothetical protein
LAFAGAQRYHSGGFAGLKPGEIPAILRQGEPVGPAAVEAAARKLVGLGISKASSRDSKPVTVNNKIVNAIDAGSFVSAGLNTKEGEQAIINFMTQRPDALKRALGAG